MLRPRRKAELVSDLLNVQRCRTRAVRALYWQARLQRAFSRALGMAMISANKMAPEGYRGQVHLRIKMPRKRTAPRTKPSYKKWYSAPPREALMRQHDAVCFLAHHQTTPDNSTFARCPQIRVVHPARRAWRIEPRAVRNFMPQVRHFHIATIQRDQRLLAVLAAAWA